VNTVRSNSSRAIARAKMLSWLVVGAISLSPVGAQADQQTCRLTQLLSLDMRTDADGRVAIPVSIQNRPARLVVDIGASFSVLDASFAMSAGLKPKNINSMIAELGGGIKLSQFVNVDQFSLANASVNGFSFITAPSAVLQPDMVGMLGADIMSHYDIDLDFAAGKFAMFLQDHCPGKVVYWTNGLSVAPIPLEEDREQHLFVPVTLDGKQIRVMLDTGAARSFMDFNLAKDVFGINENNPYLKSAGTHGLNGVVGVSVYRYPFQMLTLEGVEIHNPDIEIVKYPEHDRLDKGLTLGITVLRQLHMYIAYGEKMLYVTPAEEH
jgi:predicted aspartyl protease